MTESTTNGARWALVLAAGDGTRLAERTRDWAGRPTPKQFCSLDGRSTLLQQTIARGTVAADRGRVVVVVAAQHDRWWRADTATLDPENIVVPPLNRGTAAGILLPLLEIAHRDPEARVVVLPSDHFIAEEPAFQASIRLAFAAVESEPGAVVLLGVQPERPDPELGWILPTSPIDGRAGRVERFVEKPSAEVARELARQGGLWNSFVFVARATALLALYRSTLPDLLERLTRGDAAESVYPMLQTHDFSRELLALNPQALRVLPVTTCGWNDLGTPERLDRCALALRPVERSRWPRRLRPTAAAAF